MKRLSVSIYYDKRGVSPGFFGLKYYVYYNGKERMFATGTILNEVDVKFLKENKGGLTGRIRDEYRRELWNMVYGQTYIDPLSGKEKDSLLLHGQKVLASIESIFSFELFAHRLSNGEVEVEERYPTDVFLALRRRSDLVMGEEKVTNSELFSLAEKSFKRYAIHSKICSAKSPTLHFEQVDVKFLKGYEKWMLKEGKLSQKKGDPAGPASITTVGIYCRNLRTVFNEAIEAGVVNRNLYPFLKSGYRIPRGKNIKKALPENIVGELFDFKPAEGSMQEFYLGMWIFSYLGAGVNISDVCHLKISDLDLARNQITFYRKKTSESREDMTKIQILLLPQMIEFIKKWGCVDNKKDSFLFPILTDKMGAVERKVKIKQTIKNINANVNKIAKSLGITAKINTYEARHSFATALLRSEVPLAFISRSLGHTNIATTESYLGSFEDDQTKRYINALIPNKKG